MATYFLKKRNKTKTKRQKERDKENECPKRESKKKKAHISNIMLQRKEGRSALKLPVVIRSMLHEEFTEKHMVLFFGGRVWSGK